MPASPVAHRVRNLPALLVVVLALAGVAPLARDAAAQGVGISGRKFPTLHLTSNARGAAIPQALGAHISEVAESYGWSAGQLQTLANSDPELFADQGGRLGYVCTDLVATSSPAQNGAVVESAPFPLAQTFQLHSRPGATRTLLLDCDGNVTSGTFWNGFVTVVTPPYDIYALPLRDGHADGDR